MARVSQLEAKEFSLEGVVSAQAVAISRLLKITATGPIPSIGTGSPATVVSATPVSPAAGTWDLRDPRLVLSEENWDLSMALWKYGNWTMQNRPEILASGRGELNLWLSAIFGNRSVECGVELPLSAAAIGGTILPYAVTSTTM